MRARLCWYAVQYGSGPLLLQLADLGMRLQEAGPLLTAEGIRQHLRRGAIAALLQLGASPNQHDSYGRNPLLAVLNSQFAAGSHLSNGKVIEVVRVLLEGGADPNSTSSETGHVLELPLQLLVSSAASLQEGQMASDMSTILALAHMLCEAGADPLGLSAHSCYPLDVLAMAQQAAERCDIMLPLALLLHSAVRD